MRYGFPLIATSAMTWSLSSSDRVFLQQTTRPEEIGVYAANYRLGSVVFIFIATPIALTWVPAARRALASGLLDRTRVRWMVVFTAISWSAVAVLVALVPILVPAVFGGEFPGDRVVVLLVAAAGWLGGIYYFAATRLLLSEDTRPLIVVSIVVIAANLILNAVLIPAHGPRGAAIATVLSFGALCVVTLVTARVAEQRRSADA